MIRETSKRLGSNLGAEEIKRHSFFAEINWNDIYNKKFTPPRFEINSRDPKIKNYDYICNREITEDIKQANNKSNKKEILGWSFIK